MRCSADYMGTKKMVIYHILIDPDGCGWEKSENVLEIKWMTAKPAPEEILEFTTCACKRNSCITKRCQCYAFHLKYIDQCECNKIMQKRRGKQ